MISEKQLSIEQACFALKISRSSYYKWKQNPEFIDNDIYLKKEIQGICLEFPFYGYRRITYELKRRKINVNSKKIRRIMKEENLIPRRKKAFKPVTTQSNHDYQIYPNLIKNLEVTSLNHVWVADITYIQLNDDFIYFSGIEDIFSRRCIGWALSRNIDTNLTIDALKMAISNRKHLGFDNLIHHSDRGVQYASDKYVGLLQEYGIKISMSRKGNPYDNAHMESFNKTFKIEEVYIKEYDSFEDAFKNIKHFIELIYNKKRLHSSLGYVPPDEFEKEVLAKI